MKLVIRPKKLADAEAVRAFAQRRLAFALGRFASRLGSLNMRLTDTNGLRGGLDKLCRISIRLRPVGALAAEAAADTWQAATVQAIDRLRRVVVRHVTRRSDRTGRLAMGGPRYS